MLAYLAPANLPRLGEIAIDPPVFLFALAVSLVAGLLFGIAPVLKYAGPRLGFALRAIGRTFSDGKERHRTRSVLVVAQVALALVLLLLAHSQKEVTGGDDGLRGIDRPAPLSGVEPGVGFYFLVCAAFVLALAYAPGIGFPVLAPVLLLALAPLFGGKPGPAVVIVSLAVGILAALLAAIYPTFIDNSEQILSEPLAAFSLTAAALGFLWASDPGRRPWAWLLPGAALGATAYRLAKRSDGQTLKVCFGLIVLGMGKLGGEELNYSSDIDLILLYDVARPGGRAQDGVQSLFGRLARDLVRILDERTGDVGGVPYLTFVAAGLMAASAMLGAAAESLWPVMAGTKWVRTFHAMAATPLRPDDIYAGIVAWTTVRAAMGATIFLAVAALLVVRPAGDASLAGGADRDGRVVAGQSPGVSGRFLIPSRCDHFDQASAIASINSRMNRSDMFTRATTAPGTSPSSTSCSMRANVIVNS